MNFDIPLLLSTLFVVPFFREMLPERLTFSLLTIQAVKKGSFCLILAPEGIAMNIIQLVKVKHQIL